MTTQTQPKVKRHPIRGALWGLMMGIGVALILINFAVIAFGTIVPWIVIGVFVVLGVLWGLFAPAKKPKGEPPPPTEAATSAAAEPEHPSPPEEPEGDDSSEASQTPD